MNIIIIYIYKMYYVYFLLIIIIYYLSLICYRKFNSHFWYHQYIQHTYNKVTNTFITNKLHFNNRYNNKYIITISKDNIDESIYNKLLNLYNVYYISNPDENINKNLLNAYLNTNSFISYRVDLQGINCSYPINIFINNNFLNSQFQDFLNINPLIDNIDNVKKELFQNHINNINYNSLLFKNNNYIPTCIELFKITQYKYNMINWIKPTVIETHLKLINVNKNNYFYFKDKIIDILMCNYHLIIFNDISILYSLIENNILLFYITVSDKININSVYIFKNNNNIINSYTLISSHNIDTSNELFFYYFQQIVNNFKINNILVNTISKGNITILQYLQNYKIDNEIYKTIYYYLYNYSYNTHDKRDVFIM